MGSEMCIRDSSDPAVLKILRETQPEKWEGTFQGIHAMMYKGVRSSNSMARALSVMERLMKLPSSDLVGTDERLLFTVLANLPRFLHHFDDNAFDPGCVKSAATLAMVAESQEYILLAKALYAFATSQYRTDKDFVSHIVAAIRTAFFPALEFQSLVFLLGMVNNQCAWFKVRTMQVLCVALPDVDMRKPEIASQGPDLISPLLRLLQTEHCQQALDVLDNVIDMAGTPLDNKHLRMSMAGSHSSRATRKEYDRTKSLYGIPEESGWCIPMPAIHSAQTRSNVHAVFYTLAYAGLVSIQETPTTPEIEFHKDDYQYDSYFADRTGTMMTDDTRLNSNMGELAMKLDSLDDFFDDDDRSTADTLVDSNGRRRYPSALIEERENLYDQQALPILHHSLKRNISVTAFQTGFADPRYPGTASNREPAPVMNPAAFAHNPSLRPGLHNRSITSPAVAHDTHPPRLDTDFRSGDETEEGSFSEDDISLSRTQTDESSSYTAVAKAARGGWRSGLRRLTSSSGSREARDQLKYQVNAGLPPVKSPKVPKVPAAWLRDPMSAEP